MDTPSIIQDANVNAEAILQDATEGALLAAKNDAFMKLFRENMRFSLQLETYIETFDANRAWLMREAKEESRSTECLAIRPSSCVVFPTPLDPSKFQDITYWQKQVYLDEKRKRDKVQRKNGGRKKKKVDKDESTRMWFLQHEDGSTLTIADAIWQTICNTHGHIGAPWSKVPPYFQLTFYKELERNCSFFHLCDDHYKADAVAHADYSHWYYLHYPPPIEDEESKRQKSKASQSKENKDNEEESSVDELDNDTDAILRSVEDNTDRQRKMCQRLQCRPRLQLSPSPSSDHDVATGSAVKTPPQTSVSETQTQATVTSLAGNEDTHAASEETKKQEEQIADNVRSMNDADNMRPPGGELNDSDTGNCSLYEVPLGTLEENRGSSSRYATPLKIFSFKRLVTSLHIA
ncbi:hypothetical protein EI94DRAFT_1708618 [Lactarius quietus]|nr:hypothetical protein EI94DRAFT_1708618 [Lactarius quietus]